MLAAIFILGGYLIGAIPTGLVVGLYGFGEDIRTKGSGNIGFTNTLRVLGPAAAFLVLAGDVAKGFCVVGAAAFTFSGAPSLLTKPDVVSITDALIVVSVASAALLGNNFSIYLRFQGGKGIGIASGIILAFAPGIAAILFLIWIAVILISRYVSLASIAIALCFPVLMYFFFRLWPYEVFSIAASALAIFRHRSNIKRLLNGTELKFGESSDASPADGREGRAKR